MDEFIADSVLSERGERSDDRSDEIGPILCSKLVRVLKSGTLFSIEHEQTTEAAQQLAHWINAALEHVDTDKLSLQMTEHNLFLDGALIGIDQRSHERIQIIRQTFLERSVNVIVFREGLTSGELLQLLNAVADQDSPELDGFSLPHLQLSLVAEDEDDEIIEDERREVIELYAGLLIRCQSYFDRVRAGAHPSVKDIKRVVQRITDNLAEHRDVFVGLIHLKLMRGHDFIHAANCAVFTVILAEAAGLKKLDIVRCGMTAIAQDVDKLDAPRHIEEMEVGDQTHFETNLASVTSLSQTGTRDVLSALRLVTNYERGFPYNRPLPPEWYEDRLEPHLLSRIVEIARDYDVLIQGLEGLEAMKPDLALQALMEKMGTHYDPTLVKLFINALGIYPVGSMVRLSDGREGLVVQNSSSPGHDQLSRATRPVVRMLDGTEQLVDLSQSDNTGLYVERILGEDEVDSRPSAFLLF